MYLTMQEKSEEELWYNADNTTTISFHVKIVFVVGTYHSLNCKLHFEIKKLISPKLYGQNNLSTSSLTSMCMSVEIGLSVSC